MSLDLSGDQSNLKDLASDVSSEMPDMVADSPKDIERDSTSPDMDTPSDLQKCLNASGNLPTDISATSIGNVNGFGHSDTKKWCMRADGEGFRAGKDSGYYVASTYQGPFDLRIKMLEQAEFTADTQFGVMARKDEDPTSAFAAISAGGDGLFRFSYRGRKGLQSTEFRVKPSGEPIRWLRLTRRASWVVGLISADGQSWTRVGQHFIQGLGDAPLLGFALAGGEKPASILFDDLALTKFDNRLCPDKAPCPEPFLDMTEARRGGLDAASFDNARVYNVTSADDSGSGSLRESLEKAASYIKTSSTTFAVVRVDPSLAGKTVRVLSPLPSIKRLWVQGNGLILQGADKEPLSYIACDKQGLSCKQPPVGLSVDDLSIVQGFVLRYFDTCFDLRTLGSGIWIHNNTMEYCSNIFVNMSGNSEGKKRHIALSYNRFIGSSDRTKPSYAIQTAVCSLKASDCKDDASKTYVAIHHNEFTPSMKSWFPYGGARYVMYNNYVRELSEEAFGQLLDTGEVWSTHNVYEQRAALLVTPFKEGLVQSIDDHLIGSVKMGPTVQMVTYQPTYPMMTHDDPTAVIREVTQYAGVND